ncbi:MATE family efflux transporter [Caproicibacterium amylolyticum]|jgi:putative MATE family efflux protein|uniref:Probable multidrug resistance protein NorM n=1 Tax=Caproicibacterium amylolyticum TaxID=2766537 RepID=A0A7G9WIS6_9FIRM|nr:MATE family efflux transporter [Caproicibacterium amylolyticum]MBE6722639.1 MATE family efflux transporter [Oscillospiraceae bacterium]QNO18588.1 MATE family efflux transporter [Caproicibacterium amylolyticum]
MERQQGTLFTKRQLWQLIWPLIIEQLLAVTVGMADVMMVSSVGEAAVSAVSLVDMLNVLMLNVFAAMTTGGAVVVSQYLGAKDRESACRAASQLLTVSLLISAVFMVLCLVFCRQILRVFFGSISDEVMQNCTIVFTISAVSYPFIALYNAGAALYRSMGNSRISMMTSVFMNVMNIAGNAFFIFGVHSGVEGVTISSTISRTAGAVIMLMLIRRQENAVYASYSWQALKPNGAMIKRILRIGIPSALENSMFQLGRTMVVSIISVFGTVQVAANAVANNLDGVGCIPGQAISLAMITVIGRCVGAGDMQQVRYYTKRLTGIAYASMAVVCGSVLIFLQYIFKLYNLGPDTLDLATKLVFIHDGFAMLLWPMSFVLPNALRAANDVRFPMIWSIFSMCVFRVLFSYILGQWFGMGAVGVWIAMIIDWAFRAAVFMIRFFSGRWENFAKQHAVRTQ